jgi:hypothetical protein
MKNTKEMFIKNTDVKVEEGHIIVIDGTVYKVSYSNIPELVKKGIIVFKDMQQEEYSPYNLFPTEYDWWYTNALSEYDFQDCHEEAIGILFDDFPSAEISFILKYISDTLNYERENREGTTYSTKNGYYFINRSTGQPVFSMNMDGDFGKFSWFYNGEDAKFAAEVIKHFYE